MLYHFYEPVILQKTDKINHREDFEKFRAWKRNNY